MSAVTIILSPRDQSNFISHDQCKSNGTPGKLVHVPNLQRVPRAFQVNSNYDQFYLDTIDAPATTIPETETGPPL